MDLHSESQNKISENENIVQFKLFVTLETVIFQNLVCLP